MKRDLQKSIDEYKRIFLKENHEKFYASDIDTIKQIAERDSEKWGSKSAVLFYAISNALEAGFMIGYRFGQRQS